MKVLMLSWEFPPQVAGGLGRHVAELAPALAEQGVDVHVLAPHTNPTQITQQLQPNLTVHWVNIANVDLQANIYHRAYQVNELMDIAANSLWYRMDGFDLIHAHDWLVAFAAIELKLNHKCPLVATIHATERGRWRNNFLPNELSRKIDSVERNLTFEAWRVIACSQYMVDELGKLFSLPLDKLDMIPNGINLQSVPKFSAEEIAQFRAEYVAPGQPLIFSVGRLVYEKGLHIAISAMPQVLSHYPQTQLIIAGKGPLSEHLYRLAKDLGLSDHVHFTGFITDYQRDLFLSAASCAIFPSLYEPFGIVALEGMVFKCPVIVSNVGGLAEVVSHNNTGTLIYPDNVESAAWGILQVLNEPDKVNWYAQNAYQMAAEKYNWQRIAFETQLVYRRIIRERIDSGW